MKNKSFLEGNILSAIISFSFPLMISLVLQALYGAVDLIVVGKFGNTAGVSAVATGSQIMHCVTCIIIGLSTGVTILIGQAMGAGDDNRAANITAGMVKLLSVVAIVMTVIMMVFAEFIAKIMNVPPEAFDMTVEYIRICSAGAIFITAYNAISALFRGLGNSKSPLLFIFVACIFNIIGDLIFVGAFDMGAAGAALATVFAQFVSVVFSVWYIRKNGLPFKITKKNFTNISSVVRILKMGTPIATQDFLTAASFLIITSIVNSLGLVASASVGIVEKAFIFLSLVPMSFMSAMASFVAHNIGANQPQRAKKALFQVMAVSLACGLCVFAVTFFRGDIIINVFEDDPIVVQSAIMYLKACSFEHIIIAVTFCLLGYFNGIGHTKFVMMQGLFSAFVIRIPLSYFLSTRSYTTMFLIGLAVPISAFTSLILDMLYLAWISRKDKIKKIVE